MELYILTQLDVTQEDFEALLMDSFVDNEPMEGAVVKGRIVTIENDLAIIDVGLKTEGRVPLKEFGAAGTDGSLQIGSEVEVYIDRIENAAGEAVLSREKARREESWLNLEKLSEAGERVNGKIFNQVKGGFTVDLDGAIAFLPRSQVDIRPIRDIAPLMNVEQPFMILKMDKRRGNIVVSRRAILEESRAEQRTEIVQKLEEGQTVEGVVKNITDYGAFIDLGGIDGLLHVTDIAWRRVNNPGEVLTIGETIKVKIIRVNQETHRISLGMKQLEANPWESIDSKFPLEGKFTGRVTNITDYGAFVELEPGIEGLIHISEMSWTKKNVHPGKIVSTSQEVEIMILEVDPERRRISLGLKQCIDNPWNSFADKFPIDSIVEGEVKNKTEFGLFIGLEGEVDGMVHLSDLDWQRQGEEVLEDYNRGDVVKAKVLDVDIAKERISLGIKQLVSDATAEQAQSSGIRKGAIVTGTVKSINDGGIEVTIADSDIVAFIRRNDLSRDRADQRPDRFAVGDKLDARVTQFDKKTGRTVLSIKALEIAEEKEAVAQYGSSDSGASLGDILGAALKDKKED